jgi:hypothetical protein
MLVTLSLLTGCGTNGLAEYEKAREEIAKIEKGTLLFEVEANLEFNTEGLSEEEIKDLSYFDTIEVSAENTYDVSGEVNKLIGKYYYNLGGLGLDTLIYMNGDNFYMQLPVLDGYYKISEENRTQYDSEANKKFYEKVIEPIQAKWHELLTTEDVVQGKKTYVLSEEGQIKTTTYSINANEEQLKVLLDEMVRVIDEEDLIEDLMANEFTGNEDFDKETVINEMKEMVNKIQLKSFEGTAYVDFDGRLIKESYTIVAAIADPESGELSAIDVSYTLEHLNLSKEQDFDFPDVTEEELKDFDSIDMKEFMLTGF